jgi:hypothetical protein
MGLLLLQITQLWIKTDDLVHLTFAQLAQGREAGQEQEHKETRNTEQAHLHAAHG